MSTSASSSTYSIPTTTKGIRIHSTGGPEVLVFEEYALPSLAPNQVLVEIAYVGVNYIDTYHRTGLYKVPLPAVLGREASGIILAVGSSVKELSVGDRVVYFTSGAYAQHAVVDSTVVVKLPAGLSLKEAAAIYMQGLTAHAFTHSCYPIKAGDFVLVHAAAGGVGALMVQLAKQRGGIVIATASTQEKLDAAKKLGADYVVSYSTQNFREEVLKITDGKGVHVVYDGVGKSTWEDSLKSLRPRGLLCLYGNASGPVPAIDPFLLGNQGSVFLTRAIVSHYISERPELLERAHGVFSSVVNGKLQVRIAAELPLEKAADAHRLLEGRGTQGKVLLVVNEKLEQWHSA